MEVLFSIYDQNNNQLDISDILLEDLQKFSSINPSFFITFNFKNTTSAFSKHCRVYFTANAIEYTFKNNLTGEVTNCLSTTQDDRIVDQARGIFYHRMENKPIDDDWFEHSNKLIKLPKPYIFILDDNNVYEIDFIIERFKDLTNIDKIFFMYDHTKELAFFSLKLNDSILYTTHISDSSLFITKLETCFLQMKNTFQQIYEHYGGKFN